MRKLIGLGFLLVACRGGGSAPNPPTPGAAPGGTGAATPSAALTAFMTAAKAEDLQALGGVWGTAQGPARDLMSRSDLEMRAVYIVKCLRHDRYTVISEATAAGGRRQMNVQVNAGSVTRSTNVTLVPGPQNRWYVENLELEPLNTICLMR